MEKKFFKRFSIPILVLFACLTPILLIGAQGSLQSVSNDVKNWLPRGFQETRDYDWFLEQFGTEEMVAATWKDANLNDPRLGEFVDRLSAYAVDQRLADSDDDSPAAVGEIKPKWFRKIYSGPVLIEKLTSPPLNLSDNEAMSRLRGAFIGRDGRLSAVIAVLSSEGTEHRHQIVSLVREIANELNIPSDQLHLGGPTVDSVSLDVESQRSRNVLSLLSVAVAVVLAWICLRRLQLVVIVFAAALLGTSISVSVMHFTGAEMDLIMVMMPPLVFVLTISGAIHLINYQMDCVQHYGTHDVVGKMIQVGWLPIVLSAVTTAVGLGSLALSEVLPVKLFGLYAAAGVLLSVPVLLLFLPAMLEIWPLRPKHIQKILASEVQMEGSTHWTHGPVDSIARRYRATLAITITTVIFVGYGLTNVKTSVRLLDLFSSKAKIIKDYTWMEHNLGPLVPIEMVIDFDDVEQAREVDRLSLIHKVHSALDSMPSVGGTVSAATFTPEPPPQRSSGLTAREMIERRLLERKLSGSHELLIEEGLLRDTEKGALWRVSARVDAISDIDYGTFVDRLRQIAEPIVEDWSEQNDAAAEVTITGMVPLVYKAQRTLLHDLITSFVTAFALIGLLMMILLRSVRAGLVSMLPNAFPAVMVFGFLGWSGSPIGIGQMMTASLALGIAVDDTIHLLNWFRKEITAGETRIDAIRNSFERCAGAMLQTSVITGLAVLVFGLSSFKPTSSFSWMMSILLFLALLGELILLPAILTGPWGRFFAKTPVQETMAEEPDALLEKTQASTIA